MSSSDFDEFQTGLQYILSDSILAKNVLIDEYNVMLVLNENPMFSADGSIQCIVNNNYFIYLIYW